MSSRVCVCVCVHALSKPIFFLSLSKMERNPVSSSEWQELSHFQTYFSIKVVLHLPMCYDALCHFLWTRTHIILQPDVLMKKRTEQNP